MAPPAPWIGDAPPAPQFDGSPVMSHSSPYFMHDQMRDRVAHIMHARVCRRAPPSPVWPVIALIALLTFINVFAANSLT